MQYLIESQCRCCRTGAIWLIEGVLVMMQEAEFWTSWRLWMDIKSIYINKLIIINKIPPPRGVVVIPQVRVLYQTSVRVLCSILSVTMFALFWTEFSDVVPGICLRHPARLWVLSSPLTPLWTLIPTSFLALLSSHGISQVSCVPSSWCSWDRYVYHHRASDSTWCLVGSPSPACHPLTPCYYVLSIFAQPPCTSRCTQLHEMQWEHIIAVGVFVCI